MDIYENLQKSMVIYGICPCLADDDYTFCKAKHLLMMPLHLETRNLVNNWYFSLNCNRGPYPLFVFAQIGPFHKKINVIAEAKNCL